MRAALLSSRLCRSPFAFKVAPDFEVELFKSDDPLTGPTAPVAALSLAGAPVQADAPLLADAMTTPLRASSGAEQGWRARAGAWLTTLDIATDLKQDIGSGTWWRGLAVLTGLGATALALLPDFGPIRVAPSVTLSEAELDEARAQMIMPIAYGSDTGRRMAATDAVVPLRASPERPRIEMTATLGRGDSFGRLLERAGVSSQEASQVLQLVSGATSLALVKPGTTVDIVLGRRTAKGAARPLESIDFRARLDLALSVNRTGDRLALSARRIAVDDTPLRIRGTVGTSLYRSARAAGAPAEAVQQYLRIVNGRMPVSQFRPSDEFDIIIDYRRAETGEVEVGGLIYAGLDRDGASRVQMLKWDTGGRSQFFEASGVGETRGEMSRPTNGAVSSGFGMRRHPILGYRRMHNGLDFKGGYGAPIFAATDGVVSYAGRKGGYGNFVKLNHGGGIATGYGHMSRIAVRTGTRVRRGQVIGYIGSTGLSTGPHLHYEMYRGGVAINPASVRYTQRAQLSGHELAQFRSELARLKSVRPGAALTGFTRTATAAEPPREIDRLSSSFRG